MVQVASPLAINFLRADGFSLSNESKGIVLEKDGFGKVKFLFLQNGIFKISFRSDKAIETNHSTAELNYKVASNVKKQNKSPEGQSQKNNNQGSFDKGISVYEAFGYQLKINTASGKFFLLKKGELLLESDESAFGICGSESSISLERETDSPVYGTAADFENQNNQDFVFPFFVTKNRNKFYGVLLNSAFDTFFNFSDEESVYEDWKTSLSFGVSEGPLDVYIILGDSLKEVSVKHSKLIGTPQIVPAWALGCHHQLKNYKSAHEIAVQSEKLKQNRLPVSAIWCEEQGYSDKGTNLSFNPQTFSASQLKDLSQRLYKNQNKLVVSVSSQIKGSEDSEIFLRGLEKEVFCRTPEGKDFYTVSSSATSGSKSFYLTPDLAAKNAQKFWSEEISDFIKSGVQGINLWNSLPQGVSKTTKAPCQGGVGVSGMMFADGSLPAETFSKQFDYLLSQATFYGFNKPNNRQRSFVTNSNAFIGSQKYSALTFSQSGFSANLKDIIRKSINLSTSGLSFNGPLCPFSGANSSTSSEEIEDWIKATVLLPFFQLPDFDVLSNLCSEKSLKVIRKCLNTRQKLLPYIYTQFYLHTQTGEPLVRPLSYEFSYEFSGEACERISDQYMLGDKVMVAPFVDTESQSQNIFLPAGWWFSFRFGQWIEGGRTIEVQKDGLLDIFVRDGSIIPCSDGIEFKPEPNINDISFHVFLKEAPAQGFYYEDDMETKNQELGDYNLFDINISPDGKMEIDTIQRQYKTSVREVTFYNYSPTIVSSHVEWPFSRYPTNSVKLEF